MKYKSILVAGAGRSSSALISYLLKEAVTNNWIVTVGDVSLEAAITKVNNALNGKAIQFNIEDIEQSRKTIANNDVVISLLPAHMHIQVAHICLSEKKHLLNASYVSPEMSALDDAVKKNDLLFMNECGLDPGIDHMSAMQVIHRIKAGGGILESFESFTGGLIAPDTDPENPWRYKFTWNPRNVVMAGQGTAKFLQGGAYKYIPYQQLFTRVTPVSVPGYGEYEGYANRDSLKYMETYGLKGIKTMLRGTLRNKGFCDAWNVLVQLGCCDDTYLMEGVGNMTHADFIESFLDNIPGLSIDDRIRSVFNLSPDSEEINKLNWSGLFSNEKIGLETGTPAQLLEHILNKRWRLCEGDRDLIIMWHRFTYKVKNERKEIQAHMAVVGDDEVNTAMAKTVGLPLGITAKLVMEGKIKNRGVLIPVSPEIYEPVLKELHEHGITLYEQEIS